MNILLLGGNGFIGSHLADELLKNGHKVRIIDKFPEKYRAPLPGVEYGCFDISDSVLLYESLTGIDIVYHLASVSTPGISNINPVVDLQNNLINTIQLLELMKKTEIKRIVFLSSGGAVYGNAHNLPVKENSALNPISSYGIIKLAIEKYLFMYQELYGFQPLILRPSNPYGPRQGHLSTQGVISTFLNKVHANEGIQVWGDGSAVKDYIFIKDLAEFCVNAGLSEYTGIYNVGSGNGISINEVISIIEKVTGKNIKVEYSKKKETDVGKIYLDIRKAKNDFNWSPKINLTEGVTIFSKWISSNF
jgi:UDP-glucose 4-epimerase